MVKGLLATRPKYDDGTEYLSAYALEVIKEAKSENLAIKEFEGESANKEAIEKISSLKPALVDFPQWTRQ